MRRSPHFEVLTTATEIRNAIVELLSDAEDERIVLVGFVGKDVCRLLPNAKGIDLYCWPQPGSTNPYGVEELLRSGLKVTFVEHLHCKIIGRKKKEH
jgi:hypothetical protein